MQMTFSERIGKNQPKVAIQLDSMDEELKNSLWNILYLGFSKPFETHRYVYQYEYQSFLHFIWFSIFKEKIDDIPEDTHKVTQYLREKFLYFQKNKLMKNQLLTP